MKPTLLALCALLMTGLTSVMAQYGPGTWELQLVGHDEYDGNHDGQIHLRKGFDWVSPGKIENYHSAHVSFDEYGIAPAAMGAQSNVFHIICETQPVHSFWDAINGTAFSTMGAVRIHVTIEIDPLTGDVDLWNWDAESPYSAASYHPHHPTGAYHSGSIKTEWYYPPSYADFSMRTTSYAIGYQAIPAVSLSTIEPHSEIIYHFKMVFNPDPGGGGGEE